MHPGEPGFRRRDRGRARAEKTIRFKVRNGFCDRCSVDGVADVVVVDRIDIAVVVEIGTKSWEMFRL